MSEYRRRLMQVKHPPNQIVAIYDVTTTSSATKLYDTNYYSYGKTFVQDIYIDGKKIIASGIYKQHTFDTLGEHEVIFVVKKNEINTGRYIFAGTNIKKIDFSELRTGLVEFNQTFSGCSKLIEVKGLNLKGSTTIENIFYNCSSLQNVDTEKWDLSSIKNIYRAFYGCKALLQLNVENWNTKNITNMREAFYGCTNLQSIDVSNWDVSNVLQCSSLFYGCTNLQSIDVSNCDLSNATSMSNLLYNCTGLQNINLDNLVLPQSQDADVSNIFYKVKASLDVSKLIIGKKISSLFAYYNGTTITGLENWDTSSVVNMASTFSHCELLTSLDGIANWDTSSVVNMSSMFYWTRLLTNIPIDNWDVSNVENMSYMFKGDWKIQTLNVSKWDVSKVKSIAGFLGDSYYTQTDKLVELDLSSWNLIACEDMTSAFEYRSCKLKLPDNFGVNCKTFRNIFGRAYNTIEEVDLNKFNVSNATDVSRMFYNLARRSEYDLSTWDLSKVINWDNMFRDCSFDVLIFNTEISYDARLYGYTSATANQGVFYSSSGTGSGNNNTILYYYPYPSFVDKFLPIVPSKWQKIPLFTPEECVSLTIQADDVDGIDTFATIHWTAIVNGHDIDGAYLTNITLKGQSNSEDFGYNNSNEDIIRELTFTYMGITATTTIVQRVPRVAIAATYNVTSVESATDIITANSNYSATTLKNNIRKFRINGEIIEPTKKYTFQTTGEHVVEMLIRDNDSFSNTAYMFYNVTALKNIDMSKSDMSKLTTESGSSICGYMFYNCSNLESIILPDSINYMEYYFLSGCVNCKTITILNKQAPRAAVNSPFGGGSSSTGYNNRKLQTNKLYVPVGAVGYDKGHWESVLLNANYGGFTKEEI